MAGAGAGACVVEEEYGEIGLDEGISWLTSRVLDDDHTLINSDHSKRQVKHQLHHHHQQKRIHRPKLPAEQHHLPSHTKSTSRHHNNRAKYHTNWGSRGARGSGMQAIFLDSSQRSCGTGVFLPQREGTNFQPTRKPACSPVLLPSRVVQALNLNVHAIGLQISPRQDSKANLKGGDCKSIKNKSGNDAPTKCFSQNQRSSSPEIFLPKEWTY